ncbi:MAG: hypothetical protein INH41_21185 [Myxococcaceae bacterium]|jgi:hypothetical protein|nr:hypothetical protein [Myxococcaceae bacterium]
MFLSAALAVVLSQPVPEGFRPENTAARMTFQPRAGSAAWSFDWADQEERVRGTISPGELSSGDPITVSVTVGAFEGRDFDGPVSLSLEQTDGPWRELTTVAAPAAPPRVWTARFVPPSSGRYQLEVSYRSSRLKPLRGPLEVGMGRVPRAVGLSVGIGAILLAVVYGLVLLFRKERTSSP